MRAPGLLAAAAAAGGGLLASPALAQVDLLSPAVLSAQADVRLSAADGEPSWLQDGFGKTRYGGNADRGWTTRLQLASADLFWKPAFAFDLTGYVDAVYQPVDDHPVDLQEAFLQYKPLPRPDGWRWQARAGLMYPPVSLENDGPGWTPTRTITPSAINSWIGEEGKTVAFEAKVARRFGDQELSAGGAVFTHGDTAGTELSWRGWMFSDLRSTLQGENPIPEVPDAHKPFRTQDYDSRALDEIDGRPGVYAWAEWRAPGGVTANAFYYDNAGDRTTMVDGNWTWDTRFWNFSLRWTPDAKTELLAQAMTGRTVTGFVIPGKGWRVDAQFDSAYLLASRKLGKDLITGRVDWFDVRDATFQSLDDNDERGWALTADWRHPFGEHLAALVEVTHVDSNRASRAYVGDAMRQAQTMVQTALKVAF
ncbi:MAG TPA: hypothetical protein VGM25_10930 [Caulobacteraceae bacterium]|jgi:hypothetical protein